jgi:transcriptional regulator with XRE-family HTH domain
LAQEAAHDSSRPGEGGFVSEIESGQKPGTAATLKKIAQVLNIKIDDLIP